MSLFRFKNGPHGEVQADGSAIGRALDIMAYAGFSIHLKTATKASNAIAGVAAVFSKLPPGKYTIGDDAALLDRWARVPPPLLIGPAPR